MEQVSLEKPDIQGRGDDQVHFDKWPGRYLSRCRIYGRAFHLQLRGSEAGENPRAVSESVVFVILSFFGGFNRFWLHAF